MNGLQMILNVETYDEMVGPNNEVGVKVNINLMWQSTGGNSG